MSLKISYDRVLDTFKEKGLIWLDEEYKGAREELHYICPKHKEQGIQTTKWVLLQRGHGCPKCGYEKVANALSRGKRTPYDRIKNMFDKQNLILLTNENEYFATKNPELKFICSCTPNEVQIKTLNNFLAIPHCSKCYKEAKLKLQREKSYKEFCKLCENKGYKVISEEKEYINCSSKMKYLCPKHGEQYITLSHLKEGKGCKQCGYNIAAEKTKLSYEEVLNRLNKLELNLESEYTSLQKVHIFSCKHHPNIFFNSKLNYVIYDGVSCPACRETDSEKKIRLFLQDHNINFVSQYRFEDLYRFSNKNKLSYDFYLPDYNLLIEYQGPFHDTTMYLAGVVNKIQYKDQLEKDKIKKEYAKNHQIKLLEIWHQDYKNIEEILRRELVI